MFVVKIAFFGPSGSGKSTAAMILEDLVIKHSYFEVVRLNVAAPLHAIQKFAYLQFGIKKTGQDGLLLQFLAEHFEDKLGTTFVRNLGKIDKSRNIVVINSDCRDNAYQYLKRAGFVFVRIETSRENIFKRLGVRGDITRFSRKHKVERVGMIRADYVIVNDGSLGELKVKVQDFWRRLGTA